jgi:hypothetical protein
MEEIGAILGKTVGSAELAEWARQQVEAMRAGIFDPEIWIEGQPLTVETAITTPVNVAPAIQPAYAYREPDKLASATTYPDGAATTGVGRYSGSLVAGRWHDQALAWRKQVFAATGKNTRMAKSNIIITWAATITATATTRGSRPMLSLILHARRSTPSDAIYTAYPAPVQNSNRFYWRYKLPQTQAPYFAITHGRQILAPLRLKRAPLAADSTPLVTISSGPRPLHGRGNNNNAAVNISVSGDPRLFMPRPCLGRRRRVLTRDEAGGFHDLNLKTGATNLLFTAPGGVAIGSTHGAILVEKPGRIFEAWSEAGQLLGGWTAPPFEEVTQLGVGLWVGGWYEVRRPGTAPVVNYFILRDIDGTALVTADFQDEIHRTHPVPQLFALQRAAVSDDVWMDVAGNMQQGVPPTFSWNYLRPGNTNQSERPPLIAGGFLYLKFTGEIWRAPLLSKAGLIAADTLQNGQVPTLQLWHASAGAGDATLVSDGSGIFGTGAIIGNQQAILEFKPGNTKTKLYDLPPTHLLQLHGFCSTER